MAKQKAELRVVVRDGNDTGLFWRASLSGHDVYSGPPPIPQGEVLRHSHHDSGQTHLYLPDRRIGESQGAPLKSITDKLLVAGPFSGTIRTDGYRCKPDNQKRRTLMVNVHELQVQNLSVELWAVAKKRRDLISEIISDTYEGFRLLVGFIHADWVNPELLAVIWTFAPDKLPKEIIQGKAVLGGGPFCILSSYSELATF